MPSRHREALRRTLTSVMVARTGGDTSGRKCDGAVVFEGEEKRKMKEQSLKYEFGRGNEILAKMKNRKTAKQYQGHVAKWADWLAGQGIKRMSQLIMAYGDVESAIQAWTDVMVADGKTASTVHSYIAGVCVATSTPMGAIKKPKRRACDIIRSREMGGNQRGGQEEASGRYDDLIRFQRIAGIRRAELADLTGADLVTDESGHPCIHVRKGKGGKEQLQRILPGEMSVIRPYFTGKGVSEKIFPAETMRNHLDLHALRGQRARQCYQYYLDRIRQDPEYAEQLRQEIRERYIHLSGRSDSITRFLRQIDRDSGRYKLRGSSREMAEGKGLPVEYDRLALMAVSVFHLSHWRIDVTVSNYMLAI